MEPIISTVILALGKYLLTHAGVHAASATTATLVGGAAATAIVGSAVYLAYLSFSNVVNWFRQRKYLTTKRNSINFTIKEAISKNRVAYVQGVLDGGEDKLLGGRVIEADYDDPQLQELHRHHEVVIWT